jgi:hypothetical protein
MVVAMKKKQSRLKLDPMARLVLADARFEMGPRFAATNVTEYTRGVVDTMNLVSQATKVSLRPRSAENTLLLAQQGGYQADFQRALVNAMVLADAAAWRFDFLRPIENTIALSQDLDYLTDFNRSLEDSLVLNSTAVTITTYLRTLEQTLSLTHLARQTEYLRSLLDVLLLDHQSGVKVEYLKAVVDNLGITDTTTEKRDFARALESVLSASQSATVNGDFVRDVTSLLLIVDDPVVHKEALRAAAHALALTEQAIDIWTFDRPPSHAMSVTDNAVATLIGACDNVEWDDGMSDTIYGKHVACYRTNLSISEPPSSNYGSAGPTGLTGADKWRGGVLSEAGYVYFIPFTNAFTYKFDPSTNTGANLTTNHTGTAKWAGGALGLSGNIVCAPNNATTVLHINTSNDAETTFGTFTGTNKWHGAYLNADGYAICAPRQSRDILALDPDDTGNSWTSSTVMPLGADYACGQMGPDGYSLYVVPSSSVNVAKLDTTNHQSITYSALSGGPYGGSNEYFGAVMDDTENIYCMPYNATAVLKIETGNSDNESTFGTLTGTAKYVGGALGHDTKIYSAFWNAGNCVIIRTSNDTVYTMNTWNSNSRRTVGCVAIPDGRIIVVNGNIPAIPRYYTDAGTTARDDSLLLSPYWNKL